jgi:hypothetical protein
LLSSVLVPVLLEDIGSVSRTKIFFPSGVAKSMLTQNLVNKLNALERADRNDRSCSAPAHARQTSSADPSDRFV